MTEDELSKLVKQRGVIKGSLTRIDTFVNNEQNHVNIQLLYAKYRRLPKIQEEFNAVQNSIELNDENDHTDYREEFEDMFDNLTAKLELILGIEQPVTIKQDPDATVNFSEPTTTKEHLHLPTIKIPSFNGDYTQWYHFKDTFESLILNVNSLSQIQKFHYLLASLEGEAKQLLKNLPITEANFTNAYKLLCDRYNNKKLILSKHVKNLLTLPSAKNGSTTELRHLINELTSNRDAIRALDVNVPLEDLLLIQIVLDKVDVSTLTQFQSSCDDQEIPNLDRLTKFLERKCQTEQILSTSSINNESRLQSFKGTHTSKPQHKPVRLSYMSTNINCFICSEQHVIYKCPKYLSLNPHERLRLVKTNRLCSNCLKSNHSYNQCKSTVSCFKCKSRHHTSLHFEDNSTNHEASAPPHNQNKSCSEYKGKISCHANQHKQPEILLATALVNIRDSSGNYQTCRAILDSGSQLNFVTEDLVQRCKLKRSKNIVPIESFNSLNSESKHCASIQITSLHSDFSMMIDCNILSKITSDLPSTQINFKDWNVPSNINLADPTFNIPQRIDLLLGAQVFMKILSMEQLTREGSYPILQNTKLGWILSGEYTTDNQKPHSQNTLFARNNTSLDLQLQKFWQTEEINTPAWSKEEQLCESHFIKTTVRDEDGRFIVRLPLSRQPCVLGNSKTAATSRLQFLEKKLSRNKQLREDYHEFLNEYERLGHMQPIEPSTNNETCYYLPHHAVFKRDSTSTKTRVVFDASCKSSNNISLNDILQVGPTIQQDLCSIIMRFRTHKIAFIADINKMYRQIKVDSRDCNLQRILWRKDSNEPIQEYQLTTVTYGTSSAPFLATRCLQQLAIEGAHQYPEAAQLLQRDFYVDDCISGAETIQQAINLQQDLQALLHSGGFPLRKWATNSKQLLEAIPADLREIPHSLNIDGSDTVKALGLLWLPSDDQFQIVSGISNENIYRNNKRYTKRNVLAIISSIFDPLGLLAATVITYKIFMQQIWQENLSWDDYLPEDLENLWNTIHSQLSSLNEIKIDRYVLPTNNVTSIQLHGFSDASEKAYGACVYIRSTTIDGNVTTKLMCAKSRVAPLKRLSLPRLELCGAHLLSRLISRVLQTIDLKIDQIFLWTDSNIVLAWINKSPSTWKTFVANRVSEIQNNTNVNDWNHVPSEHNPADLLSRGVSPKNLINNSLWWNGPQWLLNHQSSWSTSLKGIEPQDIPELRQKVSLISVESNDFISKFSKLLRLQRTVALCFRFLKNCRTPRNERSTSQLSVSDIDAALTACIKIAQTATYNQEINSLTNKESLPSKTKIRDLHPFLDDSGILRVGGRLQKSDLPFTSKHQIILPPKHHLTRLIVEHEHRRMLHAGPQLLIASIRMKYWIPNIRHVVKYILHKCVTCFKLNSINHSQLMGTLPSQRVRPSRAFLNCGVDYAGPIYIKPGTRRSKLKLKMYVAVFVCLSTRAIHLELVSDLTTEAFMAALRRFMARRGKCLNVYSDNGTNFVGAQNEINNLYKFLKENQQDISVSASSESCQWHFIPPHSPHFGGLWEAAVKSMKYHLRRVAGNNILTFEEMSTLLCQIEACLNSRPLTRLSDNPLDTSFLTPGHFLIGEPLCSIPDPNLCDLAVHRLSRWQHIQQMVQLIWRKWSADYLNSLQQRQKWTSEETNLEPGDVVLIKEDNLPPLRWKTAIVEKTHPGEDNLVRVVTIKNNQGVFKRPITKLSKLPVRDNFNVNNV